MASEWPWPDALDALVVAPSQHRLVLENAYVRVLDTRIAPGEQTPVHTHRWPASHYVVSCSGFVHRDAEGAVLLDTRAFVSQDDFVQCGANTHPWFVSEFPGSLAATESRAHPDSRPGTRSQRMEHSSSADT